MKIKTYFKLIILIIAVFFAAEQKAVALENPSTISSGKAKPESVREKLLMDFGWRFALGHPCKTEKDFEHATGYFSYFAKAGYGDGAAAADFDDSAWRTLDLPHDWAVEVPFDGRGGHSHGYKAIGRNFPDASVGWYRKKFFIPNSDLGRRISIEFDGVFRDSIVWINGHYLGNEPSGYSGFAYNLTEYLNYGGNNTIAVRVDAAMEEGWFYEGAGIYRHVWLTKTAPLHVAQYGTFIVSEVAADAAKVTAKTTVVNESTDPTTFSIEHTMIDADGKSIASLKTDKLTLSPGETDEYSAAIQIAKPTLWSLETPYLYTMVTTIRSGGNVVDRYETPFGIRTVRFDSNKGFFLNGKPIKLKGTNNHQDHAGVGTAIPDALQDFRIKQLKAMGSNAYRCSHNPPTPELLDACDRLGMLVIDENRLMGVTDYHFDHLKRLMLRDRNHPSVILWSLGNEEWAIEGNITGARITETMQAFAKRLDPTRRVTVAISGGWGGISKVVDVMGVNYIKHGDTDKQHADFPKQPIVGTEESTTRQTRSIYVDDQSKGYLAPLQDASTGGNIEIGWKHYAARPHLAGVFFWTGFDYRGEANPFGWPQTSTHCGILDTCGFPKDCFYYLKSWWMDEPVVHLFPHWNLPDKKGQDINVWCYSNCDQIELFLNGKSLGKKTMEKNSHLEWNVKYEPGTLLARGYKDGNEVAVHGVETTGAPAGVQLVPNRTAIKADGEDVSVVTVQVTDKEGRVVPNANNEIVFQITGPGKIIGVGNGDPSCHEPDKYVGSEAQDWKRSLFNGLAQVIVQSTRQPGEIMLTASSADLSPSVIKVKTQPAAMRSVENITPAVRREAPDREEQLAFVSPVGDKVEPMQTGKFEPTWESLKDYECPEWYRDAKFGIWAHWGPQCQPQRGDWYARNMYVDDSWSWQYKSHLETYGHPSKFGFKDIIHEWKAENWDPEILMALYKRVGAQYFVALANHHDNFDNYDSTYQPWNSVNIGPQKDLIAGWAKTARDNGLRFGVSVHAAHTWTWYEPAQGADKTGEYVGVPYDGKLTKADGEGQWWEGLDPQDLYEQKHTPSTTSNTNDLWDWEPDKGCSIPDVAYCEKFYNRTADLINKYQPDLIYFDDTILPLYPVSDAGLKLAAHYYNSSMKWHDGKLEAVLNGKKLSPDQRRYMVWDIERGQSDRIEPYPWQTCTCIGNWHYDQGIFDRHGYKSAKTVVQTLVDVVSKNGNLLLSVPVRADGTIDSDEVKVLEDIAAWMDVNKECIFGTRPWKVFGEGPASENAAPIKAQGFNEGESKFTAEDIRFTSKGDILYAIAMDRPAKPLQIKSLGEDANLLGKTIVDIQMLSSQEKIMWEQNEQALTVTSPSTQPCDYAVVFKITTR